MRQEIETLIHESLSEVNETRAEKIPTDDVDSVALYGDGGVFDSMQLVNFLLLLEEKILDTLDKEISLTSERAVSRRISPFRNVEHLVDFVLEEIELAAAA
jgi:acyl carrier protein